MNTNREIKRRNGMRGSVVRGPVMAFLAGVAIVGCASTAVAACPPRLQVTEHAATANAAPTMSGVDESTQVGRPHMTYDVLYPGVNFCNYDRVYSPNKQNFLTIAAEGHVVLYVAGAPVWCKEVADLPPVTYLRVQDDGNLQATTTNFVTSFWETGTRSTEKTGPLMLRVTDSGRMQLVGQRDKSIVWEVGVDPNLPS